jgi:hypothetical protein
MGQEWWKGMTKITWIQPYYDLILNQIPTDAKSILDVGAGYGIFGNILKNSRHDATLEAVEPFPEYDLHHYSHTYRMEWEKFYNTHEGKYDVLVSTEMIEHLPKEKAVDFLVQAKRKARKVIIATPYEWEQQDPYDNNEYQIHRCLMTVNDFINQGYSVRLLGTITKKGLTGRIYFHPKWLKFLKLIGVKPTNIIAEVEP